MNDPNQASPPPESPPETEEGQTATTTKASELQLPGELPFEELRELIRQAYMGGIDGLIDTALAQVALPADEEELLMDMAMFTIFVCCTKLVHVRREPEDKLVSLMQAFRHIMKRIDREVPASLMEFTRVVRDVQQQPGETAQ